MDISSIGAHNGASPLGNNAAADSSDPAQFFINFFKESMGEKLADLWLMKHHLTKDALAKMPPDKREAIEKQMADDIKREVEQKIQQQLAKTNNVALS